MMSQRAETKTPKPGDYVCLILGQSTRHADKLEASPWFVCSYTLYRTINIIKHGQDAKMFAGEKMEARLIASMITNGNEVVSSRDYYKTMTPINCEDTSLHEHFIYAVIVMVCILKIRLRDRNYWNVPMVGNLNYVDFILNIGDVDELRSINENPPESSSFFA